MGGAVVRGSAWVVVRIGELGVECIIELRKASTSWDVVVIVGCGLGRGVGGHDNEGCGGGVSMRGDGVVVR